MNKEFINYEQALALKKLGFNEPCIAWYNTKDEFYMVYQPGYINGKKTDYIATNINYNNTDETCSAPLYQQVFRFFREKYKLVGIVKPYDNNNEPYNLVWLCDILNIEWGEDKECHLLFCVFKLVVNL